MVKYIIFAIIISQVFWFSIVNSRKSDINEIDSQNVMPTQWLSLSPEAQKHTTELRKSLPDKRVFQEEIKTYELPLPWLSVATDDKKSESIIKREKKNSRSQEKKRAKSSIRLPIQDNKKLTKTVKQASNEPKWIVLTPEKDNRAIQQPSQDTNWKSENTEKRGQSGWLVLTPELSRPASHQRDRQNDEPKKKLESPKKDNDAKRTQNSAHKLKQTPYFKEWHVLTPEVREQPISSSYDSEEIENTDESSNWFVLTPKRNKRPPVQNILYDDKNLEQDGEKIKKIPDSNKLQNNVQYEYELQLKPKVESTHSVKVEENEISNERHYLSPISEQEEFEGSKDSYQEYIQLPKLKRRSSISPSLLSISSRLSTSSTKSMASVISPASTSTVCVSSDTVAGVTPKRLPSRTSTDMLTELAKQPKQQVQASMIRRFSDLSTKSLPVVEQGVKFGLKKAMTSPLVPMPVKAGISSTQL